MLLSLVTLQGLSCDRICEIAERPKKPKKPVEWGARKHEHEKQGALEQEAPVRDLG